MPRREPPPPYAVRLPNMGKHLYPLPVLPLAEDEADPALAAPPPPGVEGQLYLHLPFCRTICGFCAIQKVQLAPGSPVGAYLAALARELETWSEAPYVQGLAMSSVYFGGGTPSLLDERALGGLLELVHRRFRLAPGAQITFEGNVESLTREKLAAARRLGFTRLSTGVQTFDPELRRLLNLTPTEADVRGCLDAARAAGFDDFNFDLMFNLPGQTPAVWEADLRQAVAIGPTGFDVYETVLAQKTPLYGQVQRGELPFDRDPARAARNYTLAEEVLGAAGYEQQNLYVWNRRGFENRLMGSMEAIRDRALDIVGAGNSAFSWVAGRPYLAEPRLHEYIERVGRCGHGRVSTYRPSRRHLAERFMIMSLQTFVFDRRRFAAAFGEPMDEAFAAALASFRSRGLVEAAPPGFRLTALGRAWASTMAVELYDTGYLQDVMRGRLARRIAAGMTREEEFEQLLFTLFHPEAVLKGPLDPRLALSYLRHLRRADRAWTREMARSLWASLKRHRRLPLGRHLALAARSLRRAEPALGGSGR